jgi:hypothetical protein
MPNWILTVCDSSRQFVLDQRRCGVEVNDAVRRQPSYVTDVHLYP